MQTKQQFLNPESGMGSVLRPTQKVYPDLVLEGQDGYLSVNYLEIVPLVIHSIQELKQKLDELADTEENGEKITKITSFRSEPGNADQLSR